jgi:hypothetical protein
VDDSGLYEDLQVRRVDLDDPIHATDVDDNSPVGWERSTGLAGGGAPGCNGNSMFSREGEGAGNVVGVPGLNHDIGETRGHHRLERCVVRIALELVGGVDNDGTGPEN